MIKKLISESEIASKVKFVRAGHQPPTFPNDSAATGPSRTLLYSGLSLAAALLMFSGCKTPVEISGGYAVPGTNIAATVNLGTNGAAVSGNYQTGATNLTGTITVGK